MSDATPIFHKLPGRSLGPTGLAQLWLGGDHVLEVNSTFVWERYRRFFFRDIRALLIETTPLRLIWSLIHGGLGFVLAAAAGGFGWGSTFAEEEPVRKILLIFAVACSAVALVFIALLLVNLLLGPTCRCRIFTSAGWQTLAAPARLGPAQRALERLAPLIESAQTQLAPARDFAGSR